MSDKLAIDCSTGDANVRPLSAKEQTELDALAAKADEERAAESVKTANESTINTRLDDALAALKTFVDSAKPSTAAAQASAAYDASKLLARVAIGVIRLIRRRLDAVE